MSRQGHLAILLKVRISVPFPSFLYVNFIDLYLILCVFHYTPVTTTLCERRSGWTLFLQFEPCTKIHFYQQAKLTGKFSVPLTCTLGADALAACRFLGVFVLFLANGRLDRFYRPEMGSSHGPPEPRKSKAEAKCLFQHLPLSKLLTHSILQASALCPASSPALICLEQNALNNLQASLDGESGQSRRGGGS